MNILNRLQAAVLAILMLGTLTGCGGGAASGGETGSGDPVRIATKPMTEQYILGEILGLLIEQAGYDVEITKGVGGGTSNIQPAMESGEFDLYPEYTSSGWVLVLDHQAEGVDDAEMFTRLQQEYEEKFHMTWVGKYGFNNTFTVYAGTELSADATIDVATADVKSTVTRDKDDNTNITVTIPLTDAYAAQETDITVTSKATKTEVNDAYGNTLIENLNTNAVSEGSMKFEDQQNDTTISIKVYPENGVASDVETYTISVKNAHNDMRDNTVVKLWQTSTNKTVSQNDTAYTSVAAAVEAGMNEADVRATTGLVAQLDSNALQVRYAIYSNTAKAEQGTDADYSTAMGVGDYIDVSRLADGNVLVLKITKTDDSEVWLNDYNANGCTAEAVYVVYEIQK